MLRHLLNDDESLSRYLAGDLVDKADVERRIFLKERNENKLVPDHHYKLLREKTFENLNSLGDIIRVGLYNLAKSNLELRGNKIYVQQNQQNNWQQLIPFIPPLILQAAFLHIDCPITNNSKTNLKEYFNTIALKNFKYTALPHPYIPQLELYIQDKIGLHDLHIHLSGSTETDAAWQDFLSTPDKIYNELSKAYSNQKVKEQFEQESSLLDPMKFYKLLLIAQKIRSALFDFIFPSTSKTINYSPEHTIKNIIKYHGSKTSLSNINPFKKNIFNNSNYEIAIEGMMYVLIFNEIAINKRDSVATLFHFYLLILGLANRLMVQQLHQYGFEQFQKHTLNGLREISEKRYDKLFLQLLGNDLRNVIFLEGRFSPKSTQIECEGLIETILKGWENLTEKIEHYNLTIKSKGLADVAINKPQLKLIAHFIKREEIIPEKLIRHRKLRIDISKRAHVLSLLVKNNKRYKELIIGIDAAASEFDTPPEVFAPAFRKLRHDGIKHFTFHAGEDFYHIISGLRAIFEAVHFNELSIGDRIGHATATGLSTNQWAEVMNKGLNIRQGEWLDNLTFVYHLIIQSNIYELKKYIPSITNEIQKLSLIIYKSYFSIKAIEDSWLLRKYCPFLIFCDTLSEAKLMPTFNNIEWEKIKIIKSQINTESYQLLLNYHSINFRAGYQTIIEISPNEIFNNDELHLLQLSVLKYLHQKEIIIETLPTSNVRIGHHKDYSTYQLWNWLKWEQEGNYIPPIVLGTDDTGIFATNIFNEFANIYCHLTNIGKVTHNNAMAIIKRLDENSRIYRFNS